MVCVRSRCPFYSNLPVVDINADIIFSCDERKFSQRDIVIEYHSLIRIVSGEMRVLEPGRSYTFGPGDTFLLPRNQLANVIKYYKDGQPYKSISVYLKPERLETFYKKHPIKVSPIHTPGIRPLRDHLLLDSFFASILPYFDMTEALPPDIVSLKAEEAISILRLVDPGIDSVLAYFEEPGKIDLAGFMEKNFVFNLTLDKFGYLTGRSLSTFKKDFKKIFGTTPQRWLTQKRLELAYLQLKEQHRRPIDVYYEVGFENLSHFSFAFKKQFGKTPTEVIGKP